MLPKCFAVDCRCRLATPIAQLPVGYDPWLYLANSPAILSAARSMMTLASKSTAGVLMSRVSTREAMQEGFGAGEPACSQSFEKGGGGAGGIRNLWSPFGTHISPLQVDRRESERKQV